jgi:hypothetical protein
MNKNQPNLDELVSSVVLDGPVDQYIERLDAIASSTDLAERFVKLLLLQQIRHGKKLDGALSEMMGIFECIAARSESTGCILMAHLWSPASNEIGMHDVCDAIDLWLTSHQRPELTPHLTYLADTSDEEAVRKHFRQLMDVRK